MAKLTKKQEKEVDKEVTREVRERIIGQAKQLGQGVKNQAAFVKAEYRRHTSTAIIAAFGFLIALVWRDLITIMVDYFAKIDTLAKYPFLNELYTAVIVTIVCVIGIIIITRWGGSQPPIQQ